MHVDRPGAEVVAARQRHPHPAAAGEQRPEHDDRGPDALDQLVGRHGRDGRRALEARACLGAAGSRWTREAHRLEQVAHDGRRRRCRARWSSVLRAVGQDRRRHQLEHRVLGAAHRHRAAQRARRRARRCDPSGPPVCSPGDGAGAATAGRPPTRRPRRVARATPRDDLPAPSSRRAPTARLVQRRGPVPRRTAARSTADGDGVVETTEYRLAIPWFGWLFALAAARARSRQPPARRDAAARGGRHPTGSTRGPVVVLGLLAAASLAVGYLNTLFTQTVNFAADEFGASERGAGRRRHRRALRDRVRASACVVLADRVGPAPDAARRGGRCAPLLCALGRGRAVVRRGSPSRRPSAGPIAIALGLLVGIVAAEEMPRNCRAYAVSLLALADGPRRRAAP